jgi:hypothetical protein
VTLHPLDDVAAFLRRYVIFPSEHALVAVVLWIAHTHAIDAAEATPYLNIQSPDRRCGKTRLLEVIAELVPNAIFTVGTSEAALFRIIDREPTPTLLVDELDTVFGPNAKRENESLRGLLNAGHRRGGTYLRCVTEGRNQKVEQYQVFCAKVLAGIGEPPDTITDRSIVIRMRRKAPGEKVERLRNRTLITAAHPLRRQLAEWTPSIIERASDAYPALPDELDDRAQDGWEPLLALADIAGGEWPEDARAAAVALAEVRSDTDRDSLGIRLLAEVRDVFDAQPGTERMSSADLVAGLRRMELAPWADLGGNGLTQRALANLLGRYDIHPAVLRMGDQTPRGYSREMFTDAWNRYCPAGGTPVQQTLGTSPAPDKRNKRNNPLDKPIPRVIGAQRNTPVLRIENGPEREGHADVADVADVAPLNGRNGFGERDRLKLQLLNIVIRNPRITPHEAANAVHSDATNPDFTWAFNEVTAARRTVTR